MPINLIKFSKHFWKQEPGALGHKQVKNQARQETVVHRKPSGSTHGGLAGFLGSLQWIPKLGHKILVGIKGMTDTHGTDITKQAPRDTTIKDKNTPLTERQVTASPELVGAQEKNQPEAQSFHNDAFNHSCGTAPEKDPQTAALKLREEAVYKDLLKAPGMTEEKLDEVLREQTKDKVNLDLEMAIPLLRSAVIEEIPKVSEVGKQFLKLVAQENESVEQALNLYEQLQSACGVDEKELETVLGAAVNTAGNTKQKIAVARHMAGIPLQKAAARVAETLRNTTVLPHLPTALARATVAFMTGFHAMQDGGVRQTEAEIRQDCVARAVNSLPDDEVERLFCLLTSAEGKALGAEAHLGRRAMYESLAHALAVRGQTMQLPGASEFLAEYRAGPDRTRPRASSHGAGR